MERSVDSGLVKEEVFGTAECGSDWASDALSVDGMRKFFSFHTIFLGGEGERDEGCAEEAIRGSEMDVTIVTSADFKLDIAQAEWVLGVAGGIGVFTGTEKEVEGHPHAVESGAIPN